MHFKTLIALLLSLSIASAGISMVPSQFAPGGGIGGVRVGNMVLYGSSDNGGTLYVATDDDKIKSTIQLAEAKSMVMAQKLKVLFIRKKACEEFAKKLNDSAFKAIMDDIVWSILTGGVGMFVGMMGSVVLASEVSAFAAYESRLIVAGTVFTLVLAAGATYYAVHSHRFNGIYSSQWEKFKAMNKEQRVSEYKSIIESLAALTKELETFQTQVTH